MANAPILTFAKRGGYSQVGFCTAVTLVWRITICLPNLMQMDGF